MATALKEYDAKPDSKRRLTLRTNAFEYYHVTDMNDGTIFLQPRELTAPFRVSAKALNMMDQSIINLQSGNVSPAIGLSEFEA